ncbi:APC family permease [Oceanicella actignis]|uniref:Amino acid transporter n=1 Tax=Oceanicella actignis TaxID=1189325 RepID=A0A1M7SB36_9RHOB|nr:APC family permease [Oceanicella actignis]TYO91534.1 amino acid transporter [Oceanicella actignis]SET28514.1 amino acid/polyamine/organocation transporter, APC superfamily (TC 2.A.3) [Oceanicella actignis]SHN55658.1 Amino acid transporter [Oceanicella actignis]
MRPAADGVPPQGLPRRLGPGLLTLYGVGIMVGAGIYALIGQVAALAGGWAPAAFFLAALVALPTALSYAELSARLPEAGGEAAYLREAFGLPMAGLAVAAAILGGAIMSGAAVLQAGAGYLGALIEAPRWALIVAMGAGLGAAAAIGAVGSLAMAAALTLAETGGLGLAIAAGFVAPPAADWQALDAHGPGPVPAGLGAAVVLAFFAFIGFEDMVNMAEETRDPARNMPRAVLGALALVAALYALTALAAMRAVPVAELAASDRPLALVVERGLPGWGGALALAAAAGALNGILAQVVMGSRMLYGVAKSVPALAFFRHVHPRLGAPARAAAAVAGALTAAALAAPVLSLAHASASVVLAVFAAVNVALIRLKRAGPPPPGAPDVPRAVPWIGVALSLAALAGGQA